MFDDNKDIVSFVVYGKKFEVKTSDVSSSNQTINIEYASKSEVSNEDRKAYRDELKNYIDNVFDANKDSIVDIIGNVRRITENLKESKLDIDVCRENSGEYVRYRNGYYYNSCGAYMRVWDDDIHVYVDYRGIDVRFKKDMFYLESEDDIRFINAYLANLYKTVITLINMTKDNRKVKEDSPKTKTLENNI